jgi:hypothetical protein
LVRRQYRRGIQVGVVEDDVGRLAAEFGDDRGQIVGRGLQHLARGLTSAGEMNLANTGMTHEGITAFGPGRHDVHKASR